MKIKIAKFYLMVHARVIHTQKSTKSGDESKHVACSKLDQVL